MKVLFTGGGTLGPVTPLLALAEVLREKAPDSAFYWIGTRIGPERKMVTGAGIPYAWIVEAKVRRYFSLWNLLQPLLVIQDICIALFYVARFRPDVIVSAAGYTAVPVHIAGWLLGVPGIIHESDLTGTLTNKILAPFATAITVAWPELTERFAGRRVEYIGNPVRKQIFSGDARAARLRYGIAPEARVILVLGGGTGAARLNEEVALLLPWISAGVELVHLTGVGKRGGKSAPQYHAVEFDEHMGDLYALAEVVVCRAGMGTISELAAVGRACVLVPLPGGGQAENATKLFAAHAAQVIEPGTLSAGVLWKEVQTLLDDSAARQALAENIKKVLPTAAAQKLAEVVVGVLAR